MGQDGKQRIRVKYNKCFTCITNHNGQDISFVHTNLSKCVKNYNKKKPAIITYTDGINFALVDVIEYDSHYILKWQKLVDRNLPQFSTLESDGFISDDIPLADKNRWISLSNSYVFICKQSAKLYLPSGQNSVTKSVLRRFFIDNLISRKALEDKESVDIREIVKKDKIIGIKNNPVYAFEIRQTNPTRFKHYINVNDSYGFVAKCNVSYPQGVKKRIKKGGLISVGSLVDDFSFDGEEFEAIIKYYDEKDEAQKVILKDYIDFDEKFFYLDRNEKIELNDIVSEFENKFKNFELDFETLEE